MDVMLQVEETLVKLVIKEEPKSNLGDKIIFIDKCILEL